MTTCLRCGKPLDLPAYITTPTVGRCCLKEPVPDYEVCREQMEAGRRQPGSYTHSKAMKAHGARKREQAADPGAHFVWITGERGGR